MERWVCVCGVTLVGITYGGITWQRGVQWRLTDTTSTTHFWYSGIPPRGQDDSTRTFQVYKFRTVELGRIRRIHVLGNLGRFNFV